MNGLIRSEILRFRSRTLVAVVVVGGLLLIGVGLGLVAWISEPPTAEEVLIAQFELDSCPQEVRDADRALAGRTGVYYDYIDFVDDRCFSQYRSLEFAPSESVPLAVLPIVLAGSAVIFVAVGICFGASLVGADWHHRSMTTLLTWETRRHRVYAARMGTVIGGTFLVVLGLEVVLGVGLTFVTWWRGTLFGVDPLWVRTTMETGVRVAVLTAIVAGLAGAIAMMARSTGASMGVLIAYFGYEQLMQAINATHNFWVFGRSIAIFLIAEEEFARELRLDFPAATSAIALYTGVLLVVSYLVFAERDVS